LALISVLFSLSAIVAKIWNAWKGEIVLE